MCEASGVQSLTNDGAEENPSRRKYWPSGGSAEDWVSITEFADTALCLVFRRDDSMENVTARNQIVTMNPDLECLPQTYLERRVAIMNGNKDTELSTAARSKCTKI